MQFSSSSSLPLTGNNRTLSFARRVKNWMPACGHVGFIFNYFSCTLYKCPHFMPTNAMLLLVNNACLSCLTAKPLLPINLQWNKINNKYWNFLLFITNSTCFEIQIVKSESRKKTFTYYMSALSIKTVAFCRNICVPTNCSFKKRTGSKIRGIWLI